MYKKEALKILKEHTQYYISGKDLEALEVAMKVLEEQINREEGGMIIYRPCEIPIERVKDCKIVCRGLKENIRGRGYLLNAFADMVGISNKFLSEIMANKANPSAEICLKICAILGEDFNRFFTLELPTEEGEKEIND